MADLAQLRTDLAELRATRAYAFANADSHAWGVDRKLDWVHEREADLLAQIREHEC